MTVLYLIYALIGISIIIFIHELGHFLAAKKVGVRVDKFSVGFDPTVFGVRLRLLSFRRGETEYIVGLIPFGGYVKLAGETQMETDSKRKPPQADWLIAKSPGARALVFAAGAIFNIISAFLFFALAFTIGVNFITTKIGWVEPGLPAWEAGLRPGDEIKTIDGEPVEEFTELMMSVAFADRDVPLEIGFLRPGEEDIQTVRMHPKLDKGLGFQIIGIRPTFDNTVSRVDRKSAAAAAGIQKGDRILGVRVGDPSTQEDHDSRLEIVERFDATLLHQALLEIHRRRGPDQELWLLVERDGEDLGWQEVKFEKKEEQTRSERLGVFSIPPARRVSAIRKGSSAAEYLNSGDRILSLEGRSREELSWGALLELEELGDTVKLEVERSDGSIEEIAPPTETVVQWILRGDLLMESLTVRVGDLPETSPLRRAGLREGDILYRTGEEWTPTAETLSKALEENRADPVEVSVIRDGRRRLAPIRVGRVPLVEYANSDAARALPPVVEALPGTPAALLEIPRGSRLTRINDDEIETWGDLLAAVAKLNSGGWGCSAPNSPEITVHWETPGPDGEKDSDTTNLMVDEYQDLGLAHQYFRKLVKSGPLGSAELGVKRTGIVAANVFLTLRGLFRREVAAKNLSGPVGIVHAIYVFSEHGIGTLIYFLALISVNLGILNLLPFPILDGGHLLFLLIEKIKGSPVDIRIQEIATTVAFFLIIGLAIYVTYHDINRLIGF